MRIEMLIIVLTCILFTLNVAKANGLYHTYLNELEFSRYPYTASNHVSQHEILQVPQKCNKSICHADEDLAKAVLDHCFNNECKYTEYYCLQDSNHIVPFCARLNECNPHTRLVAKINETFPNYVDLFEVPCPDGYVQPNIEHGCFSLCVVDNSDTNLHEHPDVADEININTTRPGIPIKDNPNEKQPTDVNLPDHPDDTTNKPIVSLEDNTNEKDPVNDGDGPNKEDVGNDEDQVITNNGISEGTVILVVCLVLLFMVLCICALVLVILKTFKARRQEEHSSQRPIRGTWITKIKNIFNIQNTSGIEINVDNVRQAEELLPSSSQGDPRAESHDINTMRNSNIDQRMEDLKDVELDQITMEVERARGDGQSLYPSNTSVKQVYDKRSESSFV